MAMQPKAFLIGNYLTSVRCHYLRLWSVPHVTLCKISILPRRFVLRFFTRVILNYKKIKKQIHREHQGQHALQYLTGWVQLYISNVSAVSCCLVAKSLEVIKRILVQLFTTRLLHVVFCFRRMWLLRSPRHGPVGIWKRNYTWNSHDVWNVAAFAAAKGV